MSLRSTWSPTSRSLGSRSARQMRSRSRRKGAPHGSTRAAAPSLCRSESGNPTTADRRVVRHFRSKPGDGIRVAAWVAAWAGGCSADVPGRVFGRILPPSDLYMRAPGSPSWCSFPRLGPFHRHLGRAATLCRGPGTRSRRDLHTGQATPATLPNGGLTRTAAKYSNALTRAAILRPRPPFHQEEAISAAAVPVVRDEEAAGSNPATPTASSLVNTLPSDHVRLPRGDMPESGTAGVRFWERPGRD